MFSEVSSIEELKERTIADKNITGSQAATANRYPIRFVLFDNFRDSYEYSDFLLQQQGCSFVGVEQWADADYPDLMLTYSALANNIMNYVKQTASPEKDYIITPFSELARFYDNKQYKEFHSLVATLKGIEASREAIENNQRIYIPVVGLEGKFEGFAKDSQICVWYFKNPDKQLNYRLVMTNGTTYNVSGIEDRITLVKNVTEWLRVWRDKSCKPEILSISPSIFANAEYAQPDNAFTFCECKNAYEFLVHGLNLDLGTIPYKPSDEEYWERLASEIDISNFTFGSFFNRYFHIDDLADYKVFLKTWFECSDMFEKWLLTNYYLQRFCNKGYICQSINAATGYQDYEFFSAIALTIFDADKPESMLEERAICMNYAQEKGVQLTAEAEISLCEKIEKVAQESGYASAIRYISMLTKGERRLVIEWAGKNKITPQMAADCYPELGYYLNRSTWSFESEQLWARDYIDLYKQARISDSYTEAIKKFIDNKNCDEASFNHWYHQFKTTKTVLDGRSDIDVYYWIDGLGLEWVSYIRGLLSKTTAMYLNEVHVARATIPTTTADNKQALFDIAHGDLKKIGDLDAHAHKITPYPDSLIDEMEIVSSAISEILKGYAGKKIAILSDHGLTALSQKCKGANLAGVESDHHGRVALRKSGKSVSDRLYINLPDKRMSALKHESLCASVPNGQSAHGGCTPEEVLIPVLVFSAKNEVSSYAIGLHTSELSGAAPFVVVEIRGLAKTDMPLVKYNGVEYKLKKREDGLFESERMNISEKCTKLNIIIGNYAKEFDIKINTGAEEDDLFDL